MIEEQLSELAEIPFTFKDRGTVIPSDRRPVWRMTLVVCLLRHCSRGQKSSLVRLHILDWAMRNTEGRQQLMAFIDGEIMLRYICVRYDPALLRAVLIGEAEQILKIVGKSVKLLSVGQTLAREVEKSKTILTRELEFMKVLGKNFTEKKADQFLKSGVRQ